MNKLSIHVIELDNRNGHKTVHAFNDWSDTICLDLVDKDGVNQHFESDALHISEWAWMRNFASKVHDITIDLDAEDITSFKTTEGN